MTTINLRDFYQWYTHDEFVEVPDEVAAELCADRRYEKIHNQRMRRNKSYYSLDVGDCIEASTISYFNDSPDAILEKKLSFCRLCRALNSLPEIQGRRIEAHYILGKSYRELAEDEDVDVSTIRKAIKRGLWNMKKLF